MRKCHAHATFSIILQRPGVVKPFMNTRHQTTPRQEGPSFAKTSEGKRPKLSEVGPASAKAMADRHTPVLLHETLEALQIRPDDVVLDATLGGAGHAAAICSLLGKKGMLIGIDADKAAVERAHSALSAAKARIHLEISNFRHLKGVLENCSEFGITKALFDLGWSAYQLAAGRGFSFLADEPLLMTYSSDTASPALTARTIVNEWEEGSIADVLWGWGEERFARRIARAIVEARARKPIETSRELGELVRAAVPFRYQKGKLHPATKTFQALRIAVNDELGALKEGLRAAWLALETGGRLAVISFHSIEDREVKRLMLLWSQQGEGVRLTKSPQKPSREEIVANPRARSAKLRVIEKA